MPGWNPEDVGIFIFPGMAVQASQKLVQAKAENLSLFSLLSRFFQVQTHPKIKGCGESIQAHFAHFPSQCGAHAVSVRG